MLLPIRNSRHKYPVFCVNQTVPDFLEQKRSRGLGQPYHTGQAASGNSRIIGV